jgi:hypothetical protein
MRRVRNLLVFPFVLLALAACESATGLDEVTMEGRWDAVGPLREAVPALRLVITADAGGVFTGTWTRQDLAGSRALGGVRTGNSVVVTLEAYPLPGGGFGPRTFTGELEDIWVMRGSIDIPLEGATFRRSSFSP